MIPPPAMPDTPPTAAATPEFWRQLVASGEFWFRVASDSMAPTLLPGDEVLVLPLERQPRRGEVIVFLHGDHLVVHRCRGGASFRGDGRIAPDPPVAAEQVVGMAVAGRRDRREWPLADSLPWPTRAARVRLRCSRSLRLCLRILARFLRPWRP